MRFSSSVALLLTGLAAVAMFAGSCSSDLGGSIFENESPCDGELEGQCGGPCSALDDCPAGLFCTPEGACGADCTESGGQCTGALECTPNGQCQDPGSGEGGFALSGSGGAGGGPVGEGGNCGDVVVEFSPEIPTVVLLIDQSGSMTEDFNGQGTRWDVVYDALMNPVDGVVTQLQPITRFGLALYTFNTSAPSCPELIEFKPPALNSASMIDALYAPEVPEANTPTGDSIDAIVPELAAFAEPGPKLIILATDGNPDRCEDPDAHDQVSMDLATTAATNAYNQSISTVIVAVGDQVSDQHQQDMANAGSGLPVPADPSCIGANPDPLICAPTYEPTTKQALVNALTDIILGQRTCVFTLDGAVIPGKECDGVVTVNNMTIPCNDPDGWQLNNPTEIEFVGATCDTILTDPDVTVSANFPCNAISNPPN
jgi:hypothetical protein